ncbi:PREDICTED: protein NDRG3-like isoform X2 [Priapulus caudatus]|uniref:Protein NDRG3-like isoform X2 n=1 Tax=Priapulus caudatus TaxID=37621 RepID=A0ABM1E4P8_PRICU|nr:PREDICTED: protein NDRG3-like isoform X2 [Priapulus caudatus]XP_014667169.1 PREDICTED: protein NDRG3-like isoform X2 [Priapulus caudatus]XP_014667170.1 PREDICTED: protein NDRG3-like isoform X2 [Priapulus caudatus]
MEKLTEIELVGVLVQEQRQEYATSPTGQMSSIEDVETDHGTMQVAIQGEKTKPAMVTFHDIGQNSASCYGGFFSFANVQPLLRHFSIYHVNAPGQQENAPALPESFVYPTMEQLGEMILTVCNKLGIKRFVGFGVGAGANVLSRFAIVHPTMVDALVLINGVAKQAGWTEWGYQKVSNWYLRGKGMTEFSQDYLLWHHFGKDTTELNHDLVTIFRENLLKLNPMNLAMFVDSWIRRTDLNICRQQDPEKKKAMKGIKCQVLEITGAFSPHVDDTVDMNSRLDPTISNWMKLSDCGGLVLEEQPAKVCEALVLFLQGMGYGKLTVALAKDMPHTYPIS